MYKLSFIGLGPVGLCTAVCFAKKGFTVIGSEMDEAKARQIRSVKPPFYEPNLKELLHEVIKNGNLKIVTSNEAAVMKSDITFITVGTPSNRDGSINLQHVTRASEEIGRALRKKKAAQLIAVKSTVTSGTTLDIVIPTLEKNSGKKCGNGFLLCVNPEFLSEGNAINGTFNPDYIVIGGYNEKSAKPLETLYKDFHGENLPPIVKTNIPTAELIKYVNNTFLATKVSLINTIANICEKTPGADVTKVAEAIGKDHRINPYFLNAGLGWGGSCFPKDLKAFIAYSKKLGYNPTLIQAAYKTNQDQVKFAIQKVKDELKTPKRKRIAILGLAFKPNTDDIREARSLKIVSQLLKQGAAVTAYDPMAISNVKKILKKRIRYASSAVECLKNADCAILVTEWDEFKKLKPEEFTENMRRPILVDGRRIYDPEKFSKKLRYIAVGLGEPLKPQP
ncbi:UDP-glucose/GDP-mannose dehydrogenase family protein [Candidatus Bathyarchaeota archaeon]|nr:UDP-glucose/GDP-mannose dehydrogenase family protein [Candidatus Bathyarchaeota archaeon]